MGTVEVIVRVETVKRDITPEMVRLSIEKAVKEYMAHPAFRYETLLSVTLK